MRVLAALALVLVLSAPAAAQRGTFEVRCRAGIPFQWRAQGSSGAWQTSASNIARLPVKGPDGKSVIYEIQVDAPAGWLHRYRFHATDVRGIEYYSAGFEFEPDVVLDPFRIVAPVAVVLAVAVGLVLLQQSRMRGLRAQLEETHVRLTEAEARSGLFPLDGSIPARIDKYEVAGKLGMGGMAVVYRVRREGQELALKLPLPNLLEDPALRARFKRELKLAASLTHPNLVHIFDVNDGEGDFGYPYMVMELVSGMSLRERMRVAPLDVTSLAKVGAQILDALDRLHSRGILHRDVKPGNVMVTSTGNAKLMDFGIARDMGGETSRLTATGDIMGTPLYLAPEQIGGDPSSNDPRGDVYGVGMMLYEAMAGHLPFSSTDTVAANLEKIMQDPRPLIEARPDVPPEVAACVMRMIARDPADRYPTAREAADALRESIRASR